MSGVGVGVAVGVGVDVAVGVDVRVLVAAGVRVGDGGLGVSIELMVTVAVALACEVGDGVGDGFRVGVGGIVGAGREVGPDTAVGSLVATACCSGDTLPCCSPHATRIERRPILTSIRASNLIFPFTQYLDIHASSYCTTNLHVGSDKMMVHNRLSPSCMLPLRNPARSSVTWLNPMLDR